MKSKYGMQFVFYFSWVDTICFPLPLEVYNLFKTSIGRIQFVFHLHWKNTICFPLLLKKYNFFPTSVHFFWFCFPLLLGEFNFFHLLLEEYNLFSSSVHFSYFVFYFSWVYTNCFPLLLEEYNLFSSFRPFLESASHLLFKELISITRCLFCSWNQKLIRINKIKTIFIKKIIHIHNLFFENRIREELFDNWFIFL